MVLGKINLILKLSRLFSYAQMSDLYISWPEYHQTIEYLAAKIYQSQWECATRWPLNQGTGYKWPFQVNT
ncbi:hypothetical protein [Okeania sp. SIO3I5]|uniref:hypothetical protein n=1 Tax=Okeania sp. SIO3I5 TaxID=2607805 RepID=UPI0035C899D9